MKVSWYFALGQVIGMAIRTGVRLPLAMPSLVWKGLLGEASTTPKEDLVECDVELANVVSGGAARV